MSAQSRFICFGFDLRVIAILVIVAILLGILNNIRQPEEQKVGFLKQPSSTVNVEVEQ